MKVQFLQSMNADGHKQALVHAKHGNVCEHTQVVILKEVTKRIDVTSNDVSFTSN